MDKAYCYWFDEPESKDYEYVMNGFKKLKEFAPGISRLLTEQFEPELAGGPNLWCPMTNYTNKEVVAERLKENERHWWYVCTSPKAPFATEFIDHAGTEMRVWLWQTWDYNISGILMWMSNYWNSNVAYPDTDNVQNPYVDAMSWVSGYDTPAGLKSPWGNGDGRFLYPPEACADGKPAEPILEDPVDSIRWEVLRDGVEDYEYLSILKRLLKEKGGRLADVERAELEALLMVPEDITKGLVEFTFYPEPIERQREKIARAIVRLLK